MSEEEQSKKVEKDIIKELFSAGSNTDMNMVDRYSDFLNKILI